MLGKRRAIDQNRSIATSHGSKWCRRRFFWNCWGGSSSSSHWCWTRDPYRQLKPFARSCTFFLLKHHLVYIISAPLSLSLSLSFLPPLRYRHHQKLAALIHQQLCMCEIIGLYARIRDHAHGRTRRFEIGYMHIHIHIFPPHGMMARYIHHEDGDPSFGVFSVKGRMILVGFPKWKVATFVYKIGWKGKACAYIRLHCCHSSPLQQTRWQHLLFCYSFSLVSTHTYTHHLPHYEWISRPNIQQQ